MMKQEVWLRGPLPEIPSLLQPVAHALLQAREEVTELMKGFDKEKLWTKPAGMASAGFHLQHLTGVLDRLFTYARGEVLSENQLQTLEFEGEGAENILVEALIQNFSQQVSNALGQLKNTEESTLSEIRGVGRAQIPSTVIGLYVHTAEHTMRHVGQLLVTVAMLKDN